MSEKRRDNKNRILRTGESQRKDGRYVYKYIDTFGKPQFVYSWKLVPTDKTPAGKRDDIALREKEKEIQKDLDDGIDHIGKKMTVCQLYAKQIRHRANVRHGTKQGRKQLMRILQEDKLGACRIENVKLVEKGGVSPTLRSQAHGNLPVVAVGINGNLAGPLVASYYKGTGERCGVERDVVLCAATGQSHAEILKGLSPTLNCCCEQPYVTCPDGDGFSGGGDESMAVRHLTPLECERLQGLCSVKSYGEYKKKPL